MVNISREQRSLIAEAVTRLERQFYGRGPSNVRVSVTTDDPVSVAVLSTDSLTAADYALSNRGRSDAVIRHHEALHEVTRQDFVNAVESIVNRTVTAYLAQVHPVTGYAFRVFLFSEDATTGELDH